MGIFNSTEVYVDVIATKLTDNETTPIKNSVISGTVRGSGASEGILAGMLNGLGARAKRYHKFGKNPLKFSQGLPVVEIGHESNEPGTGGSYDPFPGDMYPIIRFRADGEFITKESDPVKHKENQRCLKRVALSVDNIIRNIKSTKRKADGSNPVNDLDDCYYLFGLDLYSEQEFSGVYGYDFWTYIKPHIHIHKQAHEGNIELFKTNELTRSIPTNSIKITNEDEDYAIKILWDYVEYTDVPVQAPLLDNEGKPVKGKIQVDTGPIEEFELDYGEGGQTSSFYLDGSKVIYSKAVDAHSYHTATVYGISHKTSVEAYGENHDVVRTIQDLPGQKTGTKQFSRLVPGDPDFGRSGFYLPICKDVLELQHTIQEEKVLTDGMLLIFHAAQEVDLKWYQQKWFKVVMVIIVAAVIYFSVGNAFKEGMTLIETITELAIQFGLGFIVELLTSKIGGEIGLILATVVAVYAASRGDFTKATAMLPSADKILIAARTVGQVGSAKVKSDIQALEKETQLFAKEVQEKKEQIHEIASMLADPAAQLNVLDILFDSRNSFENAYTPEEWLIQMKGMKNAAPIVKENISLYHSRMKTLPEVADINLATA